MDSLEIKKIWSALGKEKKVFVLFFLCGLPLSAIKAYQAYLIKPIFDKGLSPNTPFSSVLQIVYVLLGLAVVNYLFRYYQGWGLRKTSEKIAINLRRKLFRKFLYLPLEKHHENNSGQLVSTGLNDVSLYAGVVQDVFISGKEILTIIGLIGVLFYHNIGLTFLCFLIFPLYIIIFQFFGNRIRKHGGISREIFGEISNEVLQFLEGRKVIRAMNLSGYIEKRLNKKHNAYIDRTQKIFVLEENSNPIIELLGVVFFSFILIYGQKEIKSGAMTQGALISFLSTIALVIDPIRRLTRSLIKFKTWSAAGDRIFELLDIEDEKLVVSKNEKNNFENEIIFQDVSFEIKGAKILDNISFEIKKGEKVALVGDSGAGKSSVLNLLLHYFQGYTGKITIDGKDIKELNLKDLRDNYAFISQEPSLFNSTILENIILDQEYEESKFQEAIKFSCCDEFLSELEKGKDTVVGDRGTNLSGGQAQRVSLARAFYQEKPIFIIDEGTSALDNQLDAKVQKGVLELKEKTVLSIAHKLNTVKDYSKIIFFKNGKIIEMGNHEELIQKNGIYSHYYHFHVREN